jgi:hypothetical protein
MQLHTDGRGVTPVNRSNYSSISSTIALKIMKLSKYSKQIDKYDKCMSASVKIQAWGDMSTDQQQTE